MHIRDHAPKQLATAHELAANTVFRGDNGTLYMKVAFVNNSNNPFYLVNLASGALTLMGVLKVAEIFPDATVHLRG